MRFEDLINDLQNGLGMTRVNAVEPFTDNTDAILADMAKKAVELIAKK